jgi:DNA-directed RNA polymerase specialized sigma24 family protein
MSAAAKGAWNVSDESTAVLHGQLERAVTGDAEARQRLLELTRDRLMHHARCFLHGRYARLEPFAQTEDVVQQLYLKILRNQDRFWVNANSEPVRTLAEFFGHSSAWMRDVLCDDLRKAYGRDDNRPAVLPLDGSPSNTESQQRSANRAYALSWRACCDRELTTDRHLATERLRSRSASTP